MNKALALLCANAIQAAYAAENGAALVMPAGMTLIKPLTLQESFWGSVTPFGFCAKLNGDLFIVLRGTGGFGEWLVNGYIQPVLFTGRGYATAGDVMVYRQLSPQFWPLVTALEPRAKVYVTGHSLGGAVATLISAVIGSQGVTYTFCAPRTLDPASAKAYRAAGNVLYRVWNSEDSVASLPYDPGLYEHVGVPVALQYNTGSIVGNHSLTGVIAALEQLS
jgi:triacylglycerol lipase